MNVQCLEYGILIKGCTYADLRAILPIGQEGDPILGCEEHVLESRDVHGDEHYVSMGSLSHGDPIPEAGLNGEYWINSIKSLIAGVEAKWCVLVVER